MRNVTLDLAPFEEKISLHRYLKDGTGFPLPIRARTWTPFMTSWPASAEPLHMRPCTIQNLRAEKWWITCPNCFAYLRTQRGKIIIWKSPIRKRRNASGS